jgi:hypothetical protein
MVLHTAHNDHWCLNRSRLRTIYDNAVAKISAERNGLLDGPLFKAMQDIVFDTAYQALLAGYFASLTPVSGTVPPGRMHVLSALPGTGKSTFSNAFAAAVVASGGSVLFVVEQMETADQRYRDLNALMPGKVAVRTTDHQRGNDRPTKVKHPAAQFTKQDLKTYPLAICTHEAFKRDENHLFRNWRHNFRNAQGDQRRSFILIDEMVKEVTQYTIDTEAIARAVALVSKETDTNSAARNALTALNTLHTFIVARTQERVPIDTLGDQAAKKVVERIAWFTSTEAERYLEGHKDQLEKVFGFARCLSKDWAFITTDGGVTMLTGYDNNLPIEHGMMQLDGTAKLGGYEQLKLPDRVVLPGPKVSFGNMHAVIEKPPTRMALAKYLANDADNFLTELDDRGHQATR